MTKIIKALERLLGEQAKITLVREDGLWFLDVENSAYDNLSGISDANLDDLLRDFYTDVKFKNNDDNEDDGNLFD